MRDPTADSWTRRGGIFAVALSAPLVSCAPSPVVVAAPVATAVVTIPPPGALEAQLLDFHNVERAQVGAAPLGWDPTLATAAGRYATELAKLGTLRHSPAEDRPGQGENLWMGTRGAFTPARMVGGWIGEKSMFRPGIFPDVSTNGAWQSVGHYTQMIWRGTTRLGCAIRSSARDDYLVCRYAPAGNVIGLPVP